MDSGRGAEGIAREEAEKHGSTGISRECLMGWLLDLVRAVQLIREIIISILVVLCFKEHSREVFLQAVKILGVRIVERFLESEVVRGRR